ncbi:MAG: family 43 glycosylhydrolase [Rikenellaceae bacterium]
MKRFLFLATFVLTFTFANAQNVKRVAPTPRNIEHLEDGSISLGSVFPYMGLVDPHTWVEDGTVYVICGHDESWRTDKGYRMDRWEVWSTKDLLKWKHECDILPTDTYIGDQPNCWAGDICKRDGKYYWVFSNAHHNTGIMVADKITGPYRDLLGEPLLKEGIIGDTRPYDPEIYIEDGVYTISFGAGHYHMATLSEDMKSLASEPKKILVTLDGESIWTADKSTLFKHGDWYYLLYGPRYAMSKNLYGPYEEQKNHLPGGHNSIFEFNGQHYLIHEFGELYQFYRGVSMQPLYIGKDGKLSAYNSKNVDGDDRFTFDISKTGWDAEEGTTVEWNKKGYIEGEVSQKEASISSIPYLRHKTDKIDKIEFDLVNRTSSKRVRVIVTSIDFPQKIKYDQLPEIDWNSAAYVDVEVESNSKKSQKVSIDFSKFGNQQTSLRQIRIQPVADASQGKWSIDNLFIK